MEELKETRWVKVTAVIPADLYVVWDEVVGELQAKRGIDHDNEVIRNGMVLEFLCAEYITGRRQ